MLRTSASFVTVACLALGCACNRTEEPASAARPDAAAPAESTDSGGTAGSGPTTPPLPTAPVTPPAEAPACVVPLGPPAPVAAKPLQCPKDPSGNLSLPIGRVTFEDVEGKPSVDVELARDNASRERGLMYRTSMPENGGMLFSWSDERVRSFWMRNTCLPLDMLFITKDGTVAGILEQVPTLNEAARRIDCPVAHVLELNAGWARAHGVTPGMKVVIEG